MALDVNSHVSPPWMMMNTNAIIIMMNRRKVIAIAIAMKMAIVIRMPMSRKKGPHSGGHY